MNTNTRQTYGPIDKFGCFPYMGWNDKKWDCVMDRIRNAQKELLTCGDPKDAIIMAFEPVADDTGYELDLIYDIFVEVLEDELEDNQSYESAVKAAADYTITVAYEYDL